MAWQTFRAVIYFFPMKIVFSLDEKEKYVMLLKGAVRSLRCLYGPKVPVLCVYSGQNERFLSLLEQESIQVARYSPILNRETLPPECHRVLGAYLKLELSLVPELAQDEFVLYCDTDVFFYQRFDELFELKPPYVGMAREETGPYYHSAENMTYVFRGNTYTVPLPFPIWTYNSGVTLFNLGRLRNHGYIHNFLAFAAQCTGAIGNYDQSLLNYFFGKRITKFSRIFNCPPYQPFSLERGRIIHFHGPKPWDIRQPLWKDLRINHFERFRAMWLDLFTEQEQQTIRLWET